MTVLGFLVSAIYSSARSIFCLFCDPGANEEETVPLVGEEGGQRAYASLEGNSSEARGLTAHYHNWFQSGTAARYALWNIFAYLCVAVIGYSFVFEKWAICDSIYFSIVVFTTVGYGDLSPTNDASRAFTTLFALYGITILGLFFGIIGELILERHDEHMKKVLSGASARVLQRFNSSNSNRWRNSSEQSKQFSFLQEICAVAFAEAPIILVLTVLALPIFYLEGWSPAQGFYWMVVTGTTIGFGDVGPKNENARIICILWIPLAVAVLGEFLGRIARIYIDRRNSTAEQKFLKRAMTLADLRRMDADRDSRVGPDEFLRYMLVALQKVKSEEIDEIMDIFAKHDKSNSGHIDMDDLMSNFNVSVSRSNSEDSTE